jgi:glycerol uptake facilitator-like aquaporin
MTSTSRRTAAQKDRCFFETDAAAALSRRAGAEAIGSLLLMLAITGAGQMSARFAIASSVSNQLVAACATAGALVGLIVAFGSVSGGHFNPLITLLQWLRGERTAVCTAAYVIAQLLGASGGSVLASCVFPPVPAASPPVVTTSSLFASEVLASASLMLVVFGCSLSGRRDAGPFAVGAWLAAAILATPSLSYANPAVALAAFFATGPVALPGWLALTYAIAEVLGALLALPLVGLAFPANAALAREASGVANYPPGDQD